VLIAATRKLLANLWSRGAILQCAHNQSSIDILCVVYFGSVSPGALFDLDKLGRFVLQITNKCNAAAPEEGNVPPVGIPDDLSRPLPSLTCVLELGNESTFEDTRSKIRTTASGPLSCEELRQLMGEWTAAVDELRRYRKSESPTKTKVNELNEAIQRRRLAMEDCNRYSIFVRGASAETYGILDKANVAVPFATLLDVTMPSRTPEHWAMQQMRPSDRLDEASQHMAWMCD
jgi:hypothetical protein